LLEVLEAPNRRVVDDVQKLSGTDRTPLLFRSGTPSGAAPTMAAYIQRFKGDTRLRNPPAARIPFDVCLVGDQDRAAFLRPFKKAAALRCRHAHD
jgi:hypothetical protein